MIYKQLVQPDLSVVGYIAECLRYADNVAGLSNGEQTAWIAWQNTQFPHTDSTPGNVAVPCWFSYYSGGFNLGHVVWSIPGQGYYSSPWDRPKGHNVLSSIAEVERLYGCRYVGWSEDISGLRVVKGGNVVTNPDSVKRCYLACLGQEATQEQIDNRIREGQTTDYVLEDLMNSPERSAYAYKVTDAVNYQKNHPDAAKATILKPGVYTV